MRDCIGGAANIGDGTTFIDGYPAVDIYDVSEGNLSQSYSFSGDLNVPNIRLANYYDATGAHYHTGFHSNLISNRPYPIDPIDDRNGTLLANDLRLPSDAYEFRCYDHGFELKNSIRFFVKEWNTAAEFELYSNSSGLEGDPNVSGAEGTNCDFKPPFVEYCNDVHDWFDFVQSQTDGTYDTGGAVTLRSSFFPMGKIGKNKIYSR